MNDRVFLSPALSDIHRAIAKAYEEKDLPRLKKLSRQIDEIQLRRIRPLLRGKSA